MKKRKDSQLGKWIRNSIEEYLKKNNIEISLNFLADGIIFGGILELSPEDSAKISVNVVRSHLNILIKEGKVLPRAIMKRIIEKGGYENRESDTLYRHCETNVNESEFLIDVRLAHRDDKGM